MNRISDCPGCGTPRYKMYKWCKKCFLPVSSPRRVKDRVEADLPISAIKRKAKTWVCSGCDKEKPKADFPKVGNKCYSCKRESTREYRKKNPGSAARSNSMRKSAVRTATPKWLSKEQKREIDQIYTERWYKTWETGVEHHVDHIIPIKGKNVCGLNVPWNLRVVTAKENLSKNNRFSEKDLQKLEHHPHNP